MGVSGSIDAPSGSASTCECAYGTEMVVLEPCADAETTSRGRTCLTHVIEVRLT